jgi:hypothetical protein
MQEKERIIKETRMRRERFEKERVESVQAHKALQVC